jgi:Uncharacterised nucleotidyltransferase
MPKSMPPAHPSDMTLFKNEWLVLLQCASPAPDLLRLAALIQSSDWSRLLVLAEEHGVVAHLAACLHRLHGNLVPPEVKQTLVERQRAQIFFTLRLSAELFRLLDRFALEGIGALVVKGPVLAVQAYGDPAMRSYGDLDLLVRQRDIRRATQLMIAAGYDSRVPISAIDAGKIPGQYLFCKPDSQLLVELHNDYTLRYFPRRLPIERFFERQIRVRLDAHEAPALSLEDELVLICIHGAKHFWERLMWIADVAALVSRQTNIDWERVADSAKEVEAQRMLHIGLRLAADLLKAQLPDKVLAIVRADAVSAQLAQRTLKWLPAAGFAPPSLLERAAFRMRMRGGLIFGPAYLLRLSLSPTEEDWNDAGQVKRHWLPDAVRRPFRLARKYGREGKI